MSWHSPGEASPGTKLFLAAIAIMVGVVAAQYVSQSPGENPILPTAPAQYHGLAMMPISDYLARIPSTELEAYQGQSDLSPSQLVSWCRANGMSMVLLNVFNHLGYTHLRPGPDLGPTSTGKTVYCQGPYVDDYIAALEAARISYSLDFWRFWHGLERQNRNPDNFGSQSIETGDYKPYLVEIARSIGERFGSSKYFVAVAWDFEYAGWSSASAEGRAGPEFNNDKEEFYSWLLDPSHAGGFCATLREHSPDIVIGLQPTNAYIAHDRGGPSQAAQMWVNHLNLRDDGDYWGKVENYQTATKGWPQVAGGVSVENAELDWHVELDHVWHYGNGWASPYGLRDHVLYWLAYNPRYVSVWGFSHETSFGKCPICGRTAPTWSIQEQGFLRGIGDRLAKVPYDPGWIATWGDLHAPRDGSLEGYGDYSAIVSSVTQAPGLIYMLESSRLWVINTNSEPIDTTIMWSDGTTHSLGVEPYDFEVVKVFGTNAGTGGLRIFR